MTDDGKTTAATNGDPPRRLASGRVLLCVVDETQELSVALQFAAMRAKRTGAHVGLLYVIEQADDFQHWATVGDLMREEARAEAEHHLLRAADRIRRLSGQLPVLYIREGKRAEQVIEQIEEDRNIAFLILGAATGNQGPGPLVSSMTGRLVGRLHIPVVIVPGNMSEEELRSFA